MPGTTCDSEWASHSLARLQERLAAPLVQRDPVPPPPLPDPAPDPLPAARAAALRFHAAVVARDYSEIRAATRGMSWEQVLALALVLADGIGTDATRLRLVTLASDEEAVA